MYNFSKIFSFPQAMKPPNMSNVTEFQLLGFQKKFEWQTLAFSHFSVHLLSHDHRECCHYCSGEPRPATTLTYEDISQLSFLSGNVIYIHYCAPSLSHFFSPMAKQSPSLPVQMAQLHFFVFFGATEFLYSGHDDL